jgi:hypothetical protein
MLALIWIFVLVTCVVDSPARAQDREPAPAEFLSRVQAYLELHRRVEEKTVPRLEVTSDPQQICDACDALAATPAVSAWFRARIGAIATPDAIAGWREDLYEHGAPRVRRLEVHARFPVGRYSSSSPIDLLQALPALPQDLAYRIVGRDLVLVDVDARLVIDVLLDAFPAAILP